MFENLRLLYQTYGGISSTIKSFYFWLAALLSTLSYDSISSGQWAGITVSIIPSITGFTIAAFALIFVVLDQKAMELLLPPGETGRSPLLQVVSSVAHAVIVQVTALITAATYLATDLSYFYQRLADVPCILVIRRALDWVAIGFSVVGFFATIYGLTLVAAAVLSIFRMLKIISDTRRGLAVKK